MKIDLPIDDRHPLCGTWIATSEDSDDYHRAEYTVAADKGRFSVQGIDCSDDERFKISAIDWNGELLTFDTLMPSTKRRGKMQMRYLDTNTVELTFTFTETEIWRKKLKR